MALKGSPELKARLKALRTAFRPIAKAWAETTVPMYHADAPVRPSSMHAGDGHTPGRLANSFRVRERTRTRAVIDGHYTAYFVNKGVRPHTIFSRGIHHPGYKARPFLKRDAWEALRKHPMSEALIDVWNEAA
jgi:hypothetical protein